MQCVILGSVEDTEQLWKRATEIIKGLTALVLQGRAKKTRTFQLEEVKFEHVTPDVCKECICYSTNAATVDLGTLTESSNR